MKVSWFHKFGGPEVLVCEETRKPTPGAGEAVVRVRAVGINHVDLDVRAGTSRIALSFPHILGREFAGEVAAIADRAGPLKEGDRVWVSCRIPCTTCEFCVSGRDNLCERGGYFGMDLPGGYAEFVKVPVSSLQRLPSHVSFQDAAASQIAFGTAWHVLINRGGAFEQAIPCSSRPQAPVSGVRLSRWPAWREPPSLPPQAVNRSSSGPRRWAPSTSSTTPSRTSRSVSWSSRGETG